MLLVPNAISVPLIGPRSDKLLVTEGNPSSGQKPLLPAYLDEDQECFFSLRRVRASDAFTAIRIY